MVWWRLSEDSTSENLIIYWGVVMLRATARGIDASTHPHKG